MIAVYIVKMKQLSANTKNGRDKVEKETQKT